MKSNDMTWTFESVDNFDTVAKNMLVLNKIPGIVKMNCAVQNGVIEINYHYRGLYDFVSQEHVKNPISVLKYIRQIASTATYCPKFLLKPECFLTNLEKLGYSKKNDLVQLVYIPEKTNQQNNADFRSLFIALLEFGGWHVENKEVEKFWNYLTDADKIQFGKVIAFCDKAARDAEKNGVFENATISSENSSGSQSSLNPDEKAQMQTKKSVKSLRKIPKHMRLKKINQNVQYDQKENFAQSMQAETTKQFGSSLPHNPQQENTKINEQQSTAQFSTNRIIPAASAAYEIPSFSKEQSFSGNKSKSKKKKPENPSLIWLLSNYSKENKEHYDNFRNGGRK